MIHFDSDMTLRWPCRKGDFITWGRFQGLFSDPKHSFKMADVWELRDGDFVTVTNRRFDLPAWFDLYPTEVSSSLVHWMTRRLREGHKPIAPLSAPNIWRIFAGDRIVWVGPNRGGVKADNGVLELVDFRENAMAYGEPFELSHGVPIFGGFDKSDVPLEGKEFSRSGWEALIGLGIPNVISTRQQWTIG